jgi:hypothetical protein
MKNYHFYEYKRLRQSLWTFYIIEVSLIAAMTTCDELLSGAFQIEQIFEYMLINVGIFPLQQAFVIFYLKSSKDPLEGISKLDAICQVSRT